MVRSETDNDKGTAPPKPVRKIWTTGSISASDKDYVEWLGRHATRHLCFLERQFFIGLQYLILILQKMLFFEPFDAFWVVSVLFAVKL
jgi:hypothetical protein